MQYSQQQCDKDHSAVNSLTVLHFPCKVYASQWSFSIILLPQLEDTCWMLLKHLLCVIDAPPSCYCLWPVPNFQPM